ncbi:EAL domain-containing protein [Shewanella sp. JM162201]|uniref:EAL domain-containing protein n=1 Tax=Shewanella jiangmenensis TaxID=2837387 RepID=A0ABS5V9I6_9GAMM|nr:EAL domain-containing protein [Shewanella jiangmenensis]MBT1446326.1 EAL domain-containing protein [Shewanella jiangmenensis]
MQKATFFKIILFFCLSWSVFAHQELSDSSVLSDSALTFNTDIFTTSQGLSQNTVTSVVEDPDGFIWIGTLNGLNRFDGSEFKKYYADEYKSLDSSFIHSLEVFNNSLLIGTDKNLLKMDLENETFSKVLDIGEPVTYLRIFDSKIFLGSASSFKVLNKDLSTEFEIKDSKLDFIKQVVSFKNRYYVRNHDGSVFSTSSSTKNLEFITNGALSIKSDVSSLTIYKRDGLYRVNENVNIEKIESNKYDYITEAGTAEISILGKVLTLKEGDSSENGILDDSLPVLSPLLFRVSNGAIIASMNNGFYYVQRNRNIVRVAVEQKNNNIWNIENYKNSILVSDESSKIRLYNQENLTIFDSIETSTNGFKATAVIDDNTIAYCTENGIFLYKKLENTHEKISERHAYSLAFSQSSNSLIIGTKDHSITSLNIENLNEKIVWDSNSPIFQIKIDHSTNKIYISHQKGLTLIRENGEIENLVINKIIYGIEFFEHNILLASGDGVLSYDTSLNKTTNLISSDTPIYSIGIFDDFIFASSINKIYVISPSSTYILQSENGAQGEYNNQGFGTYENGVILGGIQGISVINKNNLESIIEATQGKLETSLTGLFLFNEEVTETQNIFEKSINHSNLIKLKYSDYPFAIKFSTPKHNNSSVIHYYRLAGLSDEWVSTKSTRMATYTNLSPGRYTFEVYAKDVLSQKSGPVKSIAIVITPPWWMSAEAKIAYALFTMLILALILKSVLKKREVQRQIAISEERLKLSLWGSGDEMWDWDIETGKIYRSNIWGSLEFPKDGHRSGRTDEESNIHPQDQERVREALNRHFYGETDHFEAAYRVKGKDGQWVWILDRAKIVERDDSDHALRMTGTIKNINNFKLAEEQLRLFERAIENISEGMFILDSDFRFVEVNEACCDICLIDRQGFLGTTLAFSCYPEAYSEQVRIILRQQGSWSAEIESRRGDGSIFLMELTVDAIYDEQGALSHFVGVFSDISRRKQQEEELRKLTNNDLLTGLPNRSNLQVSLSNLVKKDTHHTLMVLDLDNFKKINDSLGHQIGDELLLMVANRMSSALPRHTSLYRLGGDEFAILVDKQPDIGASAAIAKGVIDAFEMPFELAGEKLVVGVSIGIVLYPEDEQNEQALLRKADIAMYHAKSAGGNRYQFYSESLNRNAMRQLEIENLIREGLRDDLFEVYYQPKVDLRNSRLAGMEALVRLVHPVHGLIPPSEFIPLAEDTGLIVEIGDLVLRKACFAAQKWREQGLFNGRVAVNLSSRQFALPDLQQRIESILRLTRLPAANLELEITEGTVIKQPEKAIKVMQQLAKMGVSLALDDFGTGYSSLSYLKRFPIHCLKIDKAFVDDIDKSDRDLKMVDSIITIAHNMGLTVVGEGVEAPAQLNILRALNCEEIQGYIYSKALPEHEFGALLERDFSEFINQKFHQR